MLAFLRTLKAKIYGGKVIFNYSVFLYLESNDAIYSEIVILSFLWKSSNSLNFFKTVSHPFSAAYPEKQLECLIYLPFQVINT